MCDGVMLMIDNDGVAHRYDDTFDITIHCESQEEQDKVKRMLQGMEWIPCSERLPEDDKSVLATTAWGEVTIAERVYPPINDTCWFIYDGNTNATIDDVVAWMPLPAPYQRGEECEHID